MLVIASAIAVTSHKRHYTTNYRQVDFLFKHLVQANSKKKFEVPCYWIFWGESTGDLWISIQRVSNGENVLSHTIIMDIEATPRVVGKLNIMKL